MEQNLKELLLKDLCARLPYGVIVEITSWGGTVGTSYDMRLDAGLLADLLHSEDDFKPYLRLMSSMTEDEAKEIQKINWQFCKPKSGDCYVGDADDGYCSVSQMANILGYLNEHHFDYRGLIEKGLAIEAPKGMYELNEK